jgi:NAD(P)-dependent dehydrogenase (short-subunit alcohol dehydrogenase family)
MSRLARVDLEAQNVVIEEFGRVDYLVSNAGVTVDKTVRRMTVEDWHAVLRVNLWSSDWTCDQPSGGSGNGRLRRRRCETRW